jgi:hypothetical protein
MNFISEVGIASSSVLWKLVLDIIIYISAFFLKAESLILWKLLKEVRQTLEVFVLLNEGGIKCEPLSHPS